MTTKEPQAYLSNTNGMWRLIWKGIPICADTPSRQRAEAVAKQYSIPLPSIIWNGEGWTTEAN
jgi:hypothetical protein